MYLYSINKNKVIWYQITYKWYQKQLKVVKELDLSWNITINKFLYVVKLKQIENLITYMCMVRVFITQCAKINYP